MAGLAAGSVAEQTDDRVFGPQVSGDEPHLDDAATLESLLRRFTQGLLEARAEWLSGAEEEDGALNRVLAAARGLGETLLGEHPEYQASSWFSPAGLGRTLGKRFQLACAPEETPYVLLLNFAGRMLSAVDAGAGGELPSYLVAHRLDAGIAGMRDAFLGMNLEALGDEQAAQAARAQQAATASYAGSLQDALEAESVSR